MVGVSAVVLVAGAVAGPARSGPGSVATPAPTGVYALKAGSGQLEPQTLTIVIGGRPNVSGQLLVTVSPAYAVSRTGLFLVFDFVQFAIARPVFKTEVVAKHLPCGDCPDAYRFNDMINSWSIYGSQRIGQVSVAFDRGTVTLPGYAQSGMALGLGFEVAIPRGATRLNRIAVLFGADGTSRTLVWPVDRTLFVEQL